MMFALYHFIRRMDHIIPQVIETKFVVRAIGDVSLISLASCI